ncbi:MAG TPA: ABC transporter permease [Candidatus Acidoferrum sp.]|nr:ABC transporter permease [Candidatus Acidoferrum sp.]
MRTPDKMLKCKYFTKTNGAFTRNTRKQFAGLRVSTSMNVLTNLRHSLRQIFKNPGFFAVAVAALALGIGANTAIFSAVEAVLLRPLPYFQPDRLVMVWEDSSFIGFPDNTPAPANYLDWKAQNTVFTDMAARQGSSMSLTGGGAPEQLFGQRVTTNFFDVLGVPPVIGRVFTPEEDKAKEQVVLISYGLWQRRFGGDPSIVGRAILLNNKGTKVLGVMPRGFFFREKNVDYWTPLYFTPERWAQRGNHFLNVVARLKPGVTPEQAQTEMDTIAARLQQQYPETNAKVGATVRRMQEDFAGDTKDGLLVLQVASVFVLLIACSNLANLLLARSTGRKREMAVRIALGATRGQIAAQMLSESLLLSVAGGALGLVVGQACWSAFSTLVPPQIGQVGFQIDWRVLLFTAGISIAAGVLFAIAPALRASDVSLQEALKDGGRSGESRSGMKLRDGLVVTEFGLAFALLVCAGLMIQTIWNLRKQDLGFRADHLLTMAVPLPDTKYDTKERRRSFYNNVAAGVRSLPGVKGADFISDAPFTANGDTYGYIVEGEPPLQPGQVNDALYREVTPSYFQTVGAALREGRFLQESDREGGQLVVVVNEFLARRHWPGQSAIGKRLHFEDKDEPWRTVAGVVRDIRDRGLLLGMKPAIYVPVNQVKPDSFSCLVVRTAMEPKSAVKAVENTVWAVDSEQPVTLVRTMGELIEANVSDRTRPMILLGVFAALALVLACTGVYGVLAYAVAQRTREIGVRMALGAKPVDVTRMVLRRGMSLSAIGLLAGGALAAALSGLLRSLLFGVTPIAPAIYAGTGVALVLVAMAACVIPAHRASRVDPVVALRNE